MIVNVDPNGWLRRELYATANPVEIAWYWINQHRTGAEVTGARADFRCFATGPTIPVITAGGHAAALADAAAGRYFRPVRAEAKARARC
jgi:hypothetical protein